MQCKPRYKYPIRYVHISTASNKACVITAPSGIFHCLLTLDKGTEATRTCNMKAGISSFHNLNNCQINSYIIRV